MRKQKSFLKKVQLLQSALLVFVILIILSLVRISAILPGISKEADQQKIKATQIMYEKEYVRGSILDRNGKALAWSEEAGGRRFHSSPYALSGLLGYYSKIYGTSGLEARFHSVLSHSPSPSGQKRGADVKLTIDRDLQSLAFGMIKKFNGSVVVLDAQNGEILALASSPSYNEEALEEKWEAYNKKEGVFLPNAFMNPIAPGSVFKLITSKAILSAHLENKTVEDRGKIRVNGQTIHNYNGTEYGTLDWEEGFVKSSNVYFMTMALKMGGQALSDAAKDFMIGEDIELDFTTLHSAWDLETGEDNVVAVTAFGQGNTLVTPLQMAMVTQSIANDGKMMKPHLIRSVTDAKGREMPGDFGREEVLAKPMEAQIARKIRKAMTKAGRSYELARIGKEEYEIAAKTGTAQRGDGTNNAWMVSFAPAKSPRYVVVVSRIGTKEIGKTLGPVVEEIYEGLLAVQGS